MLVDGAVFASFAFSYFYLWAISTGPWPPAGHALPVLTPALGAIAGYVVAAVTLLAANRALAREAHGTFSFTLVAGMLALACAFGLEVFAVRSAAIEAERHAYAASIQALLGWQGLHVVLVVLMGAYCLARRGVGWLSRTHRVTFDNTRLLWLYTSAQGIATFSVIHIARLAQ
jgi:cytochrome c oxidase subunit I+III